MRDEWNQKAGRKECGKAAFSHRLTLRSAMGGRRSAPSLPQLFVNDIIPNLGHSRSDFGTSAASLFPVVVSGNL